MKYNLSPVSADSSYTFYFKEPLIDLYKPSTRFDLIGRLLKEFRISIDDLKIETGKPSGQALEFSKFYGDIWLGVLIGLEKVEATFRPVPKDELLSKCCSGLYDIFGKDLLASYGMTVRAHLTVKEGAAAFLESLNPNVPPVLAPLVKARGVSFEFEIPQHELVIGVIITNSVVYSNAIYLALDGKFSSNRYSFEEACAYFRENVNRIGQAFSIELEKGS
jgi:hypothetical protein